MNTITFGEWVGCFFVIFIHLIENSGGYFYWCRLFLWILDINLQNFVRGYFLVLDAGVALTLILIFMFILIMTLIWAFQSFCHLLESDGEGPLAPVTIKCPYCGLLTQEESFRMHSVHCTPRTCMLWLQDWNSSSELENDCHEVEIKFTTAS